jgi:hypothetical protein
VSIPGRKRKLTDEQVQRARQWKSLAELAREWHVPVKAVRFARSGYQYKQPSP